MGERQLQLSEAADQKLTKWKNEPSLEELKRDFEAARDSHSATLTRIREWNDLLRVEGNARPKKVQGRSSVQPKLIRRQAEWRYPALSEPFLSSDKLFKISPVTWKDVQAAKQNELVLNWQFRTKLNRVKFVDDFVRSTHDDGTCIVQVGWKRVTIPVDQEVPVYDHYPIQDEETAQRFQMALQARDQNAEDFKAKADPATQAALDLYDEQGVPTIAQQIGTKKVTVDKVIDNRPTIEVRDPANVYIDPTCQGDIDKAMYAIISFETCKADLQKEGKKYCNLDKVDWSSNGPGTEPDHETQTPNDYILQDKTRRKIVAYEYWGYWDVNGDGTLVPFVATWIGKILIRMEKNPFPDEKIPLVVIPYLPKKRELYGETDAELLEENQKILGALMRGMIDLLGRSANGQQGMAKGMLDPLNKRRYEQGQDYEFNPTMSPQQGIIEHKYPELPQSAIIMTQMINEDAEALTGVKAFSGGLSSEAYGQVAAGIKGMIDAAGKREMSILRRLAKGMSDIGRKLIAMNSIFLSEEEVVHVTDDQFVKVRREDLIGDVDLEVDISTAEVDNAKASDMAFMLQTCGPNAGPEIMMMIMADIAELKRMPELAHRLRTFKPQPTPEQQQLQQLQLQEAALKVEKLKAEIAKINAEAAYKTSLKDREDLDYVEQETGTHHARDMQKMEAQAKGNQQLEVTKALTKHLKKDEKKPDLKAAIGFNAISDRLANPPGSNPRAPIGSLAGS